MATRALGKALGCAQLMLDVWLRRTSEGKSVQRDAEEIGGNAEKDAKKGANGACVKWAAVFALTNTHCNQQLKHALRPSLALAFTARTTSLPFRFSFAVLKRPAYARFRALISKARESTLNCRAIHREALAATAFTHDFGVAEGKNAVQSLAREIDLCAVNHCQAF